MMSPTSSGPVVDIASTCHKDAHQQEPNDHDGNDIVGATADYVLPFSLTHRTTTSMIQTTTIVYPSWHNAMAGAVAGAGARLLIAPLDLIRIRAQLERRDVYPRPSILTRLTNVYRGEGGIKALFRGNLAASYLWVGYTTVQFYVYGTIKQKLDIIRQEQKELLISSDGKDNFVNGVRQQQEEQHLKMTMMMAFLTSPTAIAFISGATAGVCATIATYPFDITRTVFAARGAVSPSTSSISGGTFRPPSTITQCAKSMYQQHGIIGFYAGHQPAVAAIIPYMGLNFAIYDFLITQGENDNHNQRNGSGSKSISLSGQAGSISGAVSKIIVYPLDTIKKRIQIQSVFGSNNVMHYNGMIDCLRKTIQSEGIHGLYRGLFPSVLKTTIGSGLTFTFFRTTKNLLETLNDY